MISPPPPPLLRRVALPLQKQTPKSAFVESLTCLDVLASSLHYCPHCHTHFSPFVCRVFVFGLFFRFCQSLCCATFSSPPLLLLPCPSHHTPLLSQLSLSATTDKHHSTSLPLPTFFIPTPISTLYPNPFSLLLLFSFYPRFLFTGMFFLPFFLFVSVSAPPTPFFSVAYLFSAAEK